MSPPRIAKRCRLGYHQARSGTLGRLYKDCIFTRAKPATCVPRPRLPKTPCATTGAKSTRVSLLIFFPNSPHDHHAHQRSSYIALVQADKTAEDQQNNVRDTPIQTLNQSHKFYFPVFSPLADPKVVGTEGNRNYGDVVPFKPTPDGEQPLEIIFAQKLDDWQSHALQELELAPSRVANYLKVTDLHPYLTGLMAQTKTTPEELTLKENPCQDVLARVSSRWIRESMRRMARLGTPVRRALLAETP